MMNACGHFAVNAMCFPHWELPCRLDRRQVESNHRGLCFGHETPDPWNATEADYAKVIHTMTQGLRGDQSHDFLLEVCR